MKEKCCFSALDTPPKAVTKLTPTRDCGSSGENERPLSSRASLAEPTANCAYRSNRFSRCYGKNSSGSQSLISAALRALNKLGANSVTGPIPDLPLASHYHKAFLPTPIAVI